MTTKQKQQCMDYEEFIDKLKGISLTASEEGVIRTSAVDAVIVEYTLRLESLQEVDNG